MGDLMKLLRDLPRALSETEFYNKDCETQPARQELDSKQYCKPLVMLPNTIKLPMPDSFITKNMLQ